ncbi:hypothetical protein WVI01_00970 [Weissella viridescens]|uniref:Amidophosphoribosyltransferase n=1 Tax=Weissella viridescens TaxID=1629 RepID=A0A0R2H1M3_WEIVI|nr:amidophosphoribosyltransferase [Weissella viridescens]GEA94174.1 hypothetical protein WVI01_00970 [Weissella viridescens]SUP58860.1 Amidophosphoribosyltransferase precursor [Weissella viridescens]
MATTTIVNERSLNEECGIFGVWDNPEAAELTFYGLHALQHRGQEGAGIVSKKADGRLWQERGLGLLSEVFADPRRMMNLVGDSAIGHVRYATAGSNGIENIQPFMVNFSDMQIALAHNVTSPMPRRYVKNLKMKVQFSNLHRIRRFCCTSFDDQKH